MKIRRKTVLNVLLIAFVLSFFLPPVSHFSKIVLNTLFAASPKIIAKEHQEKIAHYNWKLKDADWNYFNFYGSMGKVVFINFWASWRLPSEAELKSIQKLYDEYGDKVDFYIITDEERAPVEEFMSEKNFTFPVTYMIIGEPAPLTIMKPPASYILDKQGNIVVKQDDISDWDSDKIRALLDELLKAG
tara:strand:+ start:926 stop:1489 length:564 start_codon:yes stop_codon:yes gene_type:complete